MDRFELQQRLYKALALIKPGVSSRFASGARAQRYVAARRMAALLSEQLRDCEIHVLSETRADLNGPA
jgi:hypothetical protein